MPLSWVPFSDLASLGVLSALWVGNLSTRALEWGGSHGPPVWLGGPDSRGGQSWGPGVELASSSWLWPPWVGSTPHCSPLILPSLMGCGFLSRGHTVVCGWGGAVTLKPSTAPEP